jgi:hypothetical protein
MMIGKRIVVVLVLECLVDNGTKMLEVPLFALSSITRDIKEFIIINIIIIEATSTSYARY